MPGGDIDCGTRDDQLRNDVITAANRLLEATHSHDSLSLNAIARELSVPAATVASQFPDKMTLCIAIYQRYFGILGERMRRKAAEFADPAARLRAVVCAYLQFAVDYPDAYYVMFSMPGIADYPADMVEGQRPGAEVATLVTDVLADCIEAELVHRVDRHQAMVCLWATLHGLITLRASRPQFPWPPPAALVDTALASLLCQQPADSGLPS